MTEPVPGLIRKCSPVLHLGIEFVVSSDGPNEKGLWCLGSVWAADADLLLRLDDPTGRAHAAWYVASWLAEMPAENEVAAGVRDNDEPLLEYARRGCPMNGLGISRLRELVLLAAGVTS